MPKIAHTIIRKLNHDSPLNIPLTSFSDYSPNLLTPWEFDWPRTLAYWYFNIIDTKDGSSWSYILAKGKKGLLVNDVWRETKNDVYLTGLLDFPGKKLPLKLQSAKTTPHSLTTKDFKAKLKDDSITIHVDNKKYTFDKLLPDSYKGRYSIGYDIYNLNAANGTAYLCAQNVLAKGPLAPWNWLHCYLKDGTYIKVYCLLNFINKTMVVGDKRLKLDSIKHSPNTVTYRASLDDDYIHIIFKKGYTGQISYRPLGVSQWTYPQTYLSVQSIDTNLDINPNQKGYAIMETPTGFGW